LGPWTSEKYGISEMNLNEIEAIRVKLTEITGATFAAVEPVSIPRLAGQAKWLVQCSDLKRISKARYANRVWEDSEGEIYIESLSIGDSLQWIEEDYGEDGVVKAEGMDLHHLDAGEVARKLKLKFPLVSERLLAYWKIAKEYSEEYDVDLRLAYSSNGVATFYLSTKSRTAGLELSGKLQSIQRNASVIKAAMQEIDDHNAERRSKQLRG